MRNSKNKAERLREIERGKGIQYILDEAYKILENPILIQDMEYNFVAMTNLTICDDPIWCEFLNDGKLSEQTIEFFKDEGFIDEVANSTLQNGVTYLISEKLKYNRIFGQLFNNENVPVADLIALESDKPFDHNAPELVKIICDVISEELGKIEYYQQYGQLCQERILKKLIEGDITDKAIYTGYIANIDQGLKRYIFLAVIDLSNCDDGCNKLATFRKLFKQAQPNFKYYIYCDYIIILMSSDDDKLDEKNDLQKLNELFEQKNIYVGISSPFENLFELQKYYNEAINTLNNGIKNNNSEHIFLYQKNS